MSSRIDEKRRVTVPKSLADDFGFRKGTTVVFRKEKGTILMKKVDEPTDRLEEIMTWNPKRTGKVERISEKEMKEIWH